MAYVVPLLSFVVALIVGTVALRARRGWAVGVLAVLVVALMGWAIWTGRQVQGWDAMGYVILAFLICAPVLLGLGVGSVVGWWQRRKRARGG